ncbi:hypothetical protein HYN51_07430 [Limnobaculum parvum]|uniref:Uncharacterized protein n=1 Tax=Limnobaculum parvum TaxID=2172103 RepID=A0A2Y9TXK2_9GAMM|nr:hypothetical protein HYN51_07430 [Limnobaculum parvum]
MDEYSQYQQVTCLNYYKKLNNVANAMTVNSVKKFMIQAPARVEICHISKCDTLQIQPGRR